MPDKPWFKNIPDGVLLAHELIHAYLYATGTYSTEEHDRMLDGNNHAGVRDGELQVIGLPPFADVKITENRIRAEWKPLQIKRLDW